jgi:hypothetical protein
VAVLAARTTIPEQAMIEVAARLAKIGILDIAEPARDAARTARPRPSEAGRQ